jgi:hypothetical protein|tara:strand:+ start:60 stop:353 length:294 start_codon:yes stop_codon:yes gene_type:complete
MWDLIGESKPIAKAVQDVRSEPRMSDLIGKRIAKKTWACATYANDKIKISIATGKIEIFINCENGQHATTNHTPAQAREIAAELIRLADEPSGANHE